MRLSAAFLSHNDHKSRGREIGRKGLIPPPCNHPLYYRMIGTERRIDGWWVTNVRQCPDVGAYATQSDAEEVKRGLKRFESENRDLYDDERNPKVSTKVKVDRLKAADAFVLLGFANATGWTEERMRKRIGMMATRVDGETIDEKIPVADNEELNAYAKELLGLGADADIEFVNLKGEDKPTDTDKDKPATPTTSRKRPVKKDGPSDKERIYKLWIEDKELKPDDLLKRTKATVKRSTVTNWLSSWKNGKSLPACAKSEATAS